MKELDKRLAEVEYVLKQMDFTDIEKIPQDVFDYIEKNKSQEYSNKLRADNSMDMENLNVDTVAILSYINTNYISKTARKEDIKPFNSDSLFTINNEKQEDNARNEEKSNQLVEVEKDSWFKRIWRKLFKGK